MSLHRIPTVYLRALGVTVTPLTALEVAEIVLTQRPQGEPFFIGNLNMHGLYFYHTDSSFREFCNRSQVTLVDGWPIWAIAKLTGGSSLHRGHRIGSTDWLDVILEARRPIKIVALGGTIESSKEAETRIQARWPWVHWVGVDGYARSEEQKKEQIALINKHNPDLLLVGQGMPKQEHWITRYLSELPTCMVANVGGCIDYYSGHQELAPRWLGPIGLEWLYRLAKNPSRLWVRYLVEPWKLLAALVEHHLTGRRGVGSGERP